MQFVSIRKKLSVLTVSFILMTLVVTLGLSTLFIIITARSLVVQGQKNIRDALVSKGQILIFQNQLSLKRKIEENAFADLQQGVKETILSDNEILYGTFIDSRGHVWTREYRSGKYREMFEEHLCRKSEMVFEAEYQTVQVNGENILEFFAPVYTEGGHAGTIRYGFSMGGMTQQLKSFEERMFLLLVIAFLVLLLFLAPLVYIELKAANRQAKEITEPMAQLAKVAMEIREGDFSTPVTVESNDEVGSLARDMEQMRLKLKLYHETLQKRVDDATVQMNSSLKEQLFQSNKLVTLGTLVAGTAHEINNPNNAILLGAQNVERYIQDIVPILDHYADICGDFTIGASTYSKEREKLSSAIEQISRNSRRISSIVRRLKNFGRKDTTTTFERVNLNSVVSDSIEILSREIGRSTDSFNLDLSPAIPEIIGNYQQLEQVVVNLLQNACQAVSNCGGSVHISTVHNSTNKTVEVTVADTGIGMDEQTRNQMFDSFFTRKSSEGGSGLGLFVSQRIIQEHRGSIVIDSNLNEGTRARVQIPLQPKGGENELLFTTVN